MCSQGFLTYGLLRCIHAVRDSFWCGTGCSFRCMLNRCGAVSPCAIQPTVLAPWPVAKLSAHNMQEPACAAPKVQMAGKAIVACVAFVLISLATCAAGHCKNSQLSLGCNCSLANRRGFILPVITLTRQEPCVAACRDPAMLLCWCSTMCSTDRWFEHTAISG